MSYRQSKFVQRFLAAVAALFFLSSDFISPLSVSAGVVPGVAAAIEDILYFAPAEELVPGGIIIVAGVLAAGVAYQQLNQQGVDSINQAVQSPSIPNNLNSGVAYNISVVYNSGYQTTTNTCAFASGSVTAPIVSIDNFTGWTPGFPPPPIPVRGPNNVQIGALNFNSCGQAQPSSRSYQGIPVLGVVSEVFTPLDSGGNPAGSSIQASPKIVQLSDQNMQNILDNGGATSSQLTNGQVVPAGTVVTDPAGQKKAFITTAPYTVGSGQPIPGDPATCTSDCSAFNQGTGTSTKAGTGTGTGTSSSNPSPSPSDDPLAPTIPADKPLYGDVYTLNTLKNQGKAAVASGKGDDQGCFAVYFDNPLRSDREKAFINALTGRPEEFLVIPPSKEPALFDGRQPGTNVVLELKDPPDKTVNYVNNIDQNSLDRWNMQKARELRVANACGYQLNVLTSNQYLTNFLNNLWGGTPPVSYVQTPQIVNQFPY